jgi:hypothetical protein
MPIHSLGGNRDRVNQCNFELFTKHDQWLGLEGCSVVSHDYVQTTKPCHNIFKETNDYLVKITPCGDGFYPFGKVISGTQDPPMFST